MKTLDEVKKAVITGKDNRIRAVEELSIKISDWSIENLYEGINKGNGEFYMVSVYPDDKYYANLLESKTDFEFSDDEKELICSKAVYLNTLKGFYSELEIEDLKHFKLVGLSISLPINKTDEKEVKENLFKRFIKKIF